MLFSLGELILCPDYIPVAPLGNNAFLLEPIDTPIALVAGNNAVPTILKNMEFLIL